MREEHVASGIGSGQMTSTTIKVEYDDSRASESPLKHVFWAGGVGGVIGDSFMFPLDTIKTRQQAAPHVLKYRTFQQAFGTILREEGIVKGVYSGYGPALLGSFPSTMFFFGFYEISKRMMINKWNCPETLAHLAAGLVGDLASSVFYVPSEVLKTRMQLQGRYNNPFFRCEYNYNGLMDATRTIVRVEGWGALFYGYRATLVRDLPFSALQLAFYEKLREAAFYCQGVTPEQRKADPGGSSLSVAAELATGACAGGLAGVVTTPLDVVKTRTQTQTDHRTPASVPNSTVRALMGVYRSGGLAQVFGGVGPRLVWTSVQSSVMLLVYQSVLNIMDSRYEGAPA